MRLTRGYWRRNACIAARTRCGRRTTWGGQVWRLARLTPRARGRAAIDRGCARACSVRGATDQVIVVAEPALRVFVILARREHVRRCRAALPGAAALRADADTLVQFNTTGNNGADMEIVLSHVDAGDISGADFIL